MTKIYNKKNFLKFVSLIISLVVLSASVFGLNTFAADVDYKMATAYVDPNNFNPVKTSFDDSLIDYMTQQISELNERIDVSAYGIKVSEAGDLFRAVLYNSPQLFFMNPSGYSYSYNGDKLVAFIPKYLYNKQEIPQKSAILEESMNKLMLNIDKNWNEETKALIVHDRLIINCEYATAELKLGSNANPEIYTAYGALVNKTAVCQGYTFAYNYMLSKLGIDTYFILSQPMNHAWSMVKIDGEYYHTDVTWDDPVLDKLGRVGHNYFLKSDNAFLNNSGSKHYDWQSDYKAESTLYDNSYRNEITTIMPYIGGNYYYIVNSGSDKGNIFKYDGTNKESINKIQDRWSAGGGSYWLNNYSYLATDNERLYYNTPDKIYSVKLDGSDQKLEYTITAELAKEGRIYGMKLEYDGYLYIAVTDSPNNASKIYKAVKVADEVVIPSPQPTTPPTTVAPTTQPTTAAPTTAPTTVAPTTQPTTAAPTTEPTTVAPTTQPTTAAPTTAPTTVAPTTQPTTAAPTTVPTTIAPTTVPTTVAPTTQPTTAAPVTEPTAVAPTTTPATLATDPAYLLGDVDLDGDVQIKDATLIQMYCASFVTFTQQQLLNADVDRDNDVQVKDATLIQMYIAGFISKF